MRNTNTRVDAYIAKAAPFARPILRHLRMLVHKACPETEEIMKWSFPHFDYHGMMCSMAAFKEHCAFGFWKASLMKDAEKFAKVGAMAMGHLGKVKSLDDLPSDKKLLMYIKEAVQLNDDGVKVSPKPRPTKRKSVIVPTDLKHALGKNKKAQKQFDGFTYSRKRDYIEWLTEAKASETRARRLATAIAWIAQGKGRNWKHEPGNADHTLL
jgi:uncharacterized protein YdeI (YjbR/CyaY-like superfamily)